jgi:antitoxin component YwqK of YwqJK toxin-antitoxin module
MFKTILVITILTSCYNIFPHQKCDTVFVRNDTIVKCSTFVETGKLISVNAFLNGKLHGMQIGWYSNGKLSSKANYSYGEITDTSLSYYQNGKMHILGVNNGYNVTLAENGDTLGISPMRDGKPYGISKTYYKKGKLKAVTSINDSGKNHGLCETWHEDGTRKDSTVYENGIPVESRHYFLDGKIRSFVKLVNYKITEACAWDPEGKQLETIKNGNGGGRNYSEDGKIVYWCEYKDGEENGIRRLKPGEPVPSSKK